MSQSLAMQEDAASICPYLHSEAEYRAFRLPGKILYTPFCYTQKKDRKGTILTIALFGLHGARAFASDSRYDVFFKNAYEPPSTHKQQQQQHYPVLGLPERCNTHQADAQEVYRYGGFLLHTRKEI